jgi:aryl-alcohol dehydrogenase-like predicted oxidoreductase
VSSGTGRGAHWRCRNPAVDVAIAGTTSRERLRRSAAAVARGPLPDDVLAAVEAAMARAGASRWPGVI